MTHPQSSPHITPHDLERYAEWTIENNLPQEYKEIAMNYAHLGPIEALNQALAVQQASTLNPELFSQYQIHLANNNKPTDAFFLTTGYDPEPHKTISTPKDTTTSQLISSHHDRAISSIQ